jgi:hypothetical protein
MTTLKIKPWLHKAILPAAFAGLFLTFIYVAKDMSPNRGDLKLKELQQLSANIPVFPQFTKVGTHYSSRFLDAGVYNYYISTAKYEEVERFYLQILAQEGWVKSNEESAQLYTEAKAKKLIFKKGDYRFVIEYAGESTTSWNYALNFLWR